MSSDFKNISSPIKFLEKHVGGNLDDSTIQFNNQQNLLKEQHNNYSSVLDYIKENKSPQEEYKNYYSKDTRINDYPTIINNDVNISNPIIYPKEYDPYYEYLYKKNINSINTQVIQNKLYINIDSSNRQINSVMIVDKYFKLKKNPIVFKNDTNYFKINFENADKYFQLGDKITLQGYKIYEIKYKDVIFFFDNDSNKVILDIKPNYTNTIPYYNVTLEIVGVNYNGEKTFKNIPLTLLNQVHQVELFNANINEFKYSFVIPIKFYSDNVTDNSFISDCTIKYYYVGNYPINYINAALPITIYNLAGYHVISDIDNSSITISLTNVISINDSINLEGEWVNDIFSTGGDNIQIGKIISIKTGYPSASNYSMQLSKNIENIVCIKIKSSEIPNAEKRIYSFTIDDANNKLYWENYIDDNITYEITIPVGNYNFVDLKATIEELISKVPRKFVNDDYKDIKPFNFMTIDLITTGKTIFKSYNRYILTACYYSVESDTVNNIHVIKINHPYHNLNVGDTILIRDSLDYKYISQIYLNVDTGHKVTNVINNQFYEIIIENINYITDDNANGGNAINIITKNSFRMLFNKTNTLGYELGFKYVGTPIAITPFSIPLYSYEINNYLPYVYDVDTLLLVNNSKDALLSNNTIDFSGPKYILMKCNDFNNCLNVNGPDYFYKFLLTQDPPAILYNTYVDNPVYFNPPIKYLSEFNFEFLDPSGKIFEFYNLNHSFTFEITTISNYPENTGISPNIARI